MILVTVGTQPHDFSRLIKACDDIKEDFIIQCGNTKIDTCHESFDFSNEFDKYVKEAEIIITHGGVGTIMSALKLNKKIVVVPRLKKHGEHVDDHQLEICSYLEEKELAYILTEVDKLELVISKIRKMEFKKFISNNREFNKQLKNKISIMENNGKSI